MTSDHTSTPANQPDPSTATTDHPWGAGSTLVRRTTYTLIGAGVVGPRLVDGNAEIFLYWLVLVPLCAGAIVGNVLYLRGLIPPLPYKQLQMLCPISGIVIGVAFIEMITVLALDALLATAERPTATLIGIYVGAAILVAGIFVQFMSWSDTWPDRWRPPYARKQQTQHAKAADRPVPEPASPRPAPPPDARPSVPPRTRRHEASR